MFDLRGRPREPPTSVTRMSHAMWACHLAWPKWCVRSEGRVPVFQILTVSQFVLFLLSLIWARIWKNISWPHTFKRVVNYCNSHAVYFGVVNNFSNFLHGKKSGAAPKYSFDINTYNWVGTCRWQRDWMWLTLPVVSSWSQLSCELSRFSGRKTPRREEVFPKGFSKNERNSSFFGKS